MATITPTDMKAAGAVDTTTTTLDGSSDTFAYNPGKEPVLIFNNTTAGAISPVITGSGATEYVCEGVGPIDLSGGFNVGSIAAGASVTIRLRSIDHWLRGTIDITSGTDLEAQLLEF